jgi:hypothetical protein
MIHQFGFEIFDSLPCTLVFIPKRPDGGSRFERSGRYGLTDRRQRPIGLPRVSQNPQSTDELHSRLFLGPFESDDENGPDFSGHPHMRTATSRTIVAGYINDAYIASPLSRFTEAGFGDVFMSNIPNVDSSVFENDEIRKVCRFIRLLE